MGDHPWALSDEAGSRVARNPARAAEHAVREDAVLALLARATEEWAARHDLAALREALDGLLRRLWDGADER
jgi:hypothetical protein